MPVVNQMIEPVDHGSISTLARKSADMGFEHDGLMPGPAAPIGGAPWIGGVVDHLAWAGHILGLEGRGRIGNVDLVVDAEFVARTGADAGNLGGEPAIFASRQGVRLLQQQIDAPGRRRPQPEQYAGVGQARAEFRAELLFIHTAPAKASTARGGALLSAPAT